MLPGDDGKDPLGYSSGAKVESGAIICWASAYRGVTAAGGKSCPATNLAMERLSEAT